MGRLSCLLVVVFCVGAATVRGDDWSFPDPFKWGHPPTDSPPPPLYPAPESPSPYYDSPPYYPPTGGPKPSPWLTSDLATKAGVWPEQYSADMSIGEVLGSDAEKYYGRISLLDCLTYPGDDGYCKLLRQGVTALLNCVDAKFKYTAAEIKYCFSFSVSLSSEGSASLKASEFQAANEAFLSVP